MANDIQAPRYSAILHKLLGVTEGAPVATVAPELLAVLALEVERPEWAFLGGIKLMAGSTDLAASAGNVSNIQLWNPPGSGVLAVVDRIVVGTTWPMTVYVSWSTAALTTNSVAGSRDSRNGIGVQVGAVQCRYQQAAAPLGAGTFMRMKSGLNASAPSLPMDFEIPFVISPGFGLIVSNTVQNQGTSVNFVYSERAMEPAERR